MRILIQNKNGSTSALEVDDSSTLTVTRRVSIGVDRFIDQPAAFALNELAAVTLEDAPALEAEPVLATVAPVETQPSSKTVTVETAIQDNPDEVVAQPEAADAEKNEVLESPGLTLEDLSDLTKADLVGLARSRGVEGFSTMNKGELLEALKP